MSTSHENQELGIKGLIDILNVNTRRETNSEKSESKMRLGDGTVKTHKLTLARHSVSSRSVVRASD